jgi:dipeptidase E
MKSLLLISNSTMFGRGYLDHAESEIRAHLGGIERVLFVPYALYDREAYAAAARKRFGTMGFELESIHRSTHPRVAAGRAEAIFIGGGNTFRLLNSLYQHELLPVIRARVEQGMPYIGSSAGSVVACPTLKTTNDMPIVQPPSFEALGLIGFQINAHYVDPDPNSTHMGETREVRLREFLEENELPVIGLREGAMLRIEDSTVRLKGTTGARIFRRGKDPVDVQPGALVEDLLQ